MIREIILSGFMCLSIASGAFASIAMDQLNSFIGKENAKVFWDKSLEKKKKFKWQDAGISGSYCIKNGEASAKSRFEKVRYRPSRSLHFLESLLGFYRSSVVVRRILPDLTITNGSTLSIHIDCERFLEKRCSSGGDLSVLVSGYNLSDKQAMGVSLIMATKVPIKDVMHFVSKICPEGGLRHKFTFEEASFLLHIKPTSEPKFEALTTYTAALTGALAKVWKDGGKISSDFEFDESTDLAHNIVLLLNDYLKLPPVSKEEQTGVSGILSRFGLQKRKDKRD